MWKIILIGVVSLVILLMGYTALNGGREHQPIGESPDGQPVGVSVTPAHGANAIEFLARRWGVEADVLYVLAVRQTDAGEELGVADPVSLASARVFVPGPSFGDLSQLRQESVTSEGGIYLLNEYRPSGPDEERIAREFYRSGGTPVPGRITGAIVWMELAPSGEGRIRVLTNSGYLTVPVLGGTVRKDLAFYSD